MGQRKTIFITVISLLVITGAILLLRVVYSSPDTTQLDFQPESTINSMSPARSTQYFEAHIDEARQVIAACREGTVRGDECAHAETAIVTVESKERFRRFREER